MSPGRCQAFTFKEVEKITDNFREKIGKGGFGPVYLGHLKGQKVAVKVSSDESKQGFKEFHNEVNVMVTSSKFMFGLSVALLCHQVELLSRAHHKHVSFLGYCHDAKRMILIYEYLSRGSLEDALSGKKFRHLNLDVKSANILLNDKLEAKIADFGLSKPVASEGVTHVTTAIRGTPGYWDPEYCGNCCLNEKSDVYSFGIVLLELVSGKRHLIDVPSGEKINIAHWVRQNVLEGKHANIEDPALCGRYEVDSLRRVVDLALHCTSDKGINRPKMCDVVTELKEAIRQLIEICAGFISIDCGSPEESYVYPDSTDVTYFSDSKLMEFGEIKSPDSRYIDDNNWPKYLRKVRTFPKGNMTCYKLQPVTPGSKYLIRPNFLYGNFDGLNSFPQFDLYLENTFAQTINASVSDWQTYEFIVKATRSYLTLCLCKTNERDPFISAIDLRPMPDAIYPVVNATLALKNLERNNFGRRDGNWYRFPDDTLDRFWWSPVSNGLGSINTTQNLTSSFISESVSSTDDQYVPPSVVMQTADINSDPKVGIQWSSTSIPQDADLFMCIHCAELKKLEPNETREFNITVDSKLWHGAFSPLYLSATTLCSTSTHRSQNNLVEYNPTERSTLSPIVNAMELYAVLQLSGSATDDADASSLVDIRDKYQISKAWTGDPCLPLNYTWEGLVCSNDSLSPRVISLNLSGNNLTGNIPNFLAINLIQLKMFVSGNKKLSLSNSCSSSKRNGVVGVIIGISVTAAVLVVLVFGLAVSLVMKRRKRPSNYCILSLYNMVLPFEHFFVHYFKFPKGHHVQPNGCQAFTYEEVMKVTDNFSRKIGEGGYGPVFHGRLESGQNVAVKILSTKSGQGSQEFQTEVILLSRIHHKNLVSLIGYCRSELSLDWNRRLKVAFGAAQGLDYLHYSCNPGIIHRDVKSANILLNEKLEAKIADFGVSKTGFQDGVTHISTKVVGTPGYLDPEYYSTNRLNEKSDVFSFGIVLLELISGLQPIIIEPSGGRVHIVNWVQPKLLRGDLASVADGRFCGAYDARSMWQVAEIALECATLKAAERPAMSTVVSILKEVIESGFISVDCGGQVESFVQPGCNITYFSDSKLMKFGESKSFAYSNISKGVNYLLRLRTFPKGNRNCYTLQPVTPGSKYLIRPQFLYGNFDGLNSFPQFDLYLENTFVHTVNDSVMYEFIVKATRSYLTLCLCKTNERDPFISAIDVRPLGDTIYPVVNATLALKLVRRYNFGSFDGEFYSDFFGIQWFAST
ncbi:Serine/threonine-protein kinase 10 [Nymphaea thermarum]|nr:Serine/threonine-protein kinase 10 [Nymphaea thermarum]